MSLIVTLSAMASPHSAQPLPLGLAHAFRWLDLLWPFPFTRICGLEYRLDHRHILNGVLDRHRHLSLPAHRARELIALDCILIDDRKLLNLRRCALHVADENSTWPVIRRVPGNFDFDATRCPKKMH